MRCPAVNAARVEAARNERTARVKNEPTIRLNSVVLETEGGSETDDDTTPAMRRAYELCMSEWGVDDKWLNVETRVDARYGMYQYGTGSGDVVEIADLLQPEVGILEVASSRFMEPDFRISDVHALDANTDLSCIREGGYRDWNNYKVWEWPALKWLRTTMEEQLRFKSSEETISIWPAMRGYCLHLDGTDAFYDLRHAEVLGNLFNPKRVLNQMRLAKKMNARDRPSIFWDCSLNRTQSVMLHAARLMFGASRARKNTNRPEGALPVERTAMRLKDQTRKVPEPIIVLAKINGHQIRALLDTGSMADFLSTTVVDQLNLQKEYYTKPL